MTLHTGNSAEVLKQYPDNHFDSIVTDPPYGIEFLGKDWDKNTGPIEVWRECLRVLKPGGHLLAFSAARTYHRLASNIEDIGFEIRDQIMWVYGSGFPKSHNVGNKLGEEYKGIGTALKPAHEPIVMARKPFNGTVAKNVLEYGTGGINIDKCRVGSEEREGRFPANIIFDEEAGKVLDEQSGTKGGNNKGAYTYKDKEYQVEGFINNVKPNSPSNYGDTGGASRFFYCPKVSRKERNVGCDMHEPITGKDVGPWSEKGERLAVKLDKMTTNHNNHPTVKPISLMKYLVTLVTPKGGKVLDPFNGSGSTGMAVKEFGGEYTGIDLDPHYIEISTKRIEAW